MKLTDLQEVRYASNEKQYKCKNCEAQFTERQMKTRQGVKNVKYCPNCDVGHHIYARTFTSPKTGNTQTIQSELREARYHVDHPLVVEIKQKIDSGRAFDSVDIEGDIKPPAVIDLLNGAFGNSGVVRPETESYYASVSWTVDRDNNICVRYVYGDSVADTDHTNFVSVIPCDRLTPEQR